MVDARGGDVAHADEFCCLGAAMCRNNGTINEDRTNKSKFRGPYMLTFNAAMARLLQDRRQGQLPITFNAVAAAA